MTEQLDGNEAPRDEPEPVVKRREVRHLDGSMTIYIVAKDMDESHALCYVDGTVNHFPPIL